MIKMLQLLLICCLAISSGIYSQNKTILSGDTVLTHDIGDVAKKVLKKKTDPAKPARSNGLAILPAIGYNPSFGFTLGAKISGGRQFGNQANTGFSFFSLEATYATKGNIVLQARHNIFTEGNKWNWQGHWQFSHLGIVDYGVGTGNKKYRSSGIAINEHPTKNSDSAFPIQYNYIRLSEKVYKKVSNNLYAGAGLSFDIYTKIKDEKLSGVLSTPHNRYSYRNRFNPGKYSANGLLFALQYNSREHPIRSYGGIYADIAFRFNQKWMGSTANAVQIIYDFRKYWSLSKKNPEHVLAFWHWAFYKTGGRLPYLEMPATASVIFPRSGRAYTVGRFRGPSFAYFESEYRFPITRNKLISGVCFVNLQSASDDAGKKIFSAWESGAGAGLRILFQKETRTALCIDYAYGKYGSKGIFFGITEAF